VLVGYAPSSVRGRKSGACVGLRFFFEGSLFSFLSSFLFTCEPNVGKKMQRKRAARAEGTWMEFLEEKQYATFHLISTLSLLFCLALQTTPNIAFFSVFHSAL
jgi:hypothetical protein